MGENIDGPTLEWSQETTTKTLDTYHLRGYLPKQETMCNLFYYLIIELLKLNVETFFLSESTLIHPFLLSYNLQSISASFK